MSVNSDLILHTEPCVSCGAENERFAIRLRSIKDGVERADQYCLSCACALTTGFEKLLREAPMS